MKVEEEYEGDRKKDNAKSSVSTKRSRAAAIHNQSERVSFLYFFCPSIAILYLFNFSLYNQYDFFFFFFICL